jgi:hypothetical protein
MYLEVLEKITKPHRVQTEIPIRYIYIYIYILLNPNPNPKPFREINDSAGTMKGKINLRDIIYHSRKTL